MLPSICNYSNLMVFPIIHEFHKTRLFVTYLKFDNINKK